MQLRKWLPAVLFCLLLFSSFSHLLTIQKADANPDFVSSTSSTITIENDYFKAVFDNATANKHGHIRWFYIKPDDTVNIVAESNWKFLGGHEANSLWGATTKTGTDWSSAEKQGQTCTIVAQTSDYVVVEARTEWKSTGSYLHYSNVEFWTFFVDKPYYFVSSTRTYHEQIQYNGNYEYCWLFNDTWANRYYFLNETWGIESATGSQELTIHAIWESRFAERYPWTMMYNDTYNKGHFSILASANPTTIGLGYLSASAGNYKEYQLVYGDESVEAEESHYFTVVNGVADNTTYVDSLSSSLWSSTAHIAESQTHSVASNNQSTSKPSYHTAWNLWVTPYTANQIRVGTYEYPVTMYREYIRFYPQYTNASGTYSIYTTPSIYHNWSKSYTNVTTQVDYASKIRLTTELQLWNDSDPFKLKWTFSTLANLNVTSLTVKRQYEWNTITDGTTICYLNASVIKMNLTLRTPAVEEAYTFMNQTIIDSEISTGDGDTWALWYALNQTEAEVGSGNSYTVELLIQPYKRFSFESQGCFSLADVLPLHEKSNDRFEKLCWAKFPFFDSETPFRINHLGVENGQIYGAERSSGTLTFTVVAPSGNTTTTKIYCGSKGEPRKVSGVSSWSYDASTNIGTITVLHASAEDVTLDWSQHRASGLYELKVHVLEADVPLAGVYVRVSGMGGTTFSEENMTTDSSGLVTWLLPYGHYAVKATYEEDSKRMIVMLNSDKDIGFDFGKHGKSGKRFGFELLAVPVFLLIVGLLILPRLRRR